MRQSRIARRDRSTGGAASLGRGSKRRARSHRGRARPPAAIAVGQDSTSRPYDVRVSIPVASPATVRLLVTSSQRDDLMKGRLPVQPPHPRALLTLLEGVALYSGEPLYVVISAGNHRDAWLGSEQWCEDLWPAESPLVRFDFAIPPPRRRRTLRGVGDFRDVRRQLSPAIGGSSARARRPSPTRILGARLPRGRARGEGGRGRTAPRGVRTRRTEAWEPTTRRGAA